VKKITVIEFQVLKYASRSRKEAFSLSKHWDVTLIGLNPDIKNNRVYYENNLRIVEVVVPIRDTKLRIGKPLNLVVFNFKALRSLLAYRSDVVIMHNIKPLFAVLSARMFCKFKLVYDAHELHSHKRPLSKRIDFLLTRIDMFNEWLILRLASKVIQASPERAVYFARLYKTEMPIVIENHANLADNVLHADKEYEIDRILGRKIIFTGNLSINGNQRIDNIIRSLAFIDDEIQFCLLGVGGSQIVKTLMSIAQENGVAERVHFLQPVRSEEVVSVLRKAHVAAIPIYATCRNSEYSALNKVSQSLMAGLPLACSDYANLHAIVYENAFGIAGSTFDVCNPRSIASAINDCLVNRERYVENSLLLANTTFNWESQEKKLHKVILEL